MKDLTAIEMKEFLTIFVERADRLKNKLPEHNKASIDKWIEEVTLINPATALTVEAITFLENSIFRDTVIRDYILSLTFDIFVTGLCTSFDTGSDSFAQRVSHTLANALSVISSNHKFLNEQLNQISNMLPLKAIDSLVETDTTIPTKHTQQHKIAFYLNSNRIIIIYYLFWLVV